MLSHEYFNYEDKYNDETKKILRVNKYDPWIFVHGVRRQEGRSDSTGYKEETMGGVRAQGWRGGMTRPSVVEESGSRVGEEEERGINEITSKRQIYVAPPQRMEDKKNVHGRGKMMSNVKQRGWEMDIRNMGCNQKFDTSMVLAKEAGRTGADIGEPLRSLVEEQRGPQVEEQEKATTEHILHGEKRGSTKEVGLLLGVSKAETRTQEEGIAGRFPLGYKDKGANFISNADELRDVPIIQQRKGNGRVKQGIRVGREGRGMEEGKQGEEQTNGDMLRWKASET
ncbi:hypothetical protein LIER_17981 [Lithospermum erythrorhizon]|uniref:Uncharacterized protein n=1 Tax=Lithospermum erythrorhizon TaxID=34254 RepID=A0AAV3QCC0_LITER